MYNQPNYYAYQGQGQQQQTYQAQPQMGQGQIPFQGQQPFQTQPQMGQGQIPFQGQQTFQGYQGQGYQGQMMQQPFQGYQGQPQVQYYQYGQQAPFQQQQQQVPVFVSGAPQIDPRIHQQYMSFINHASAAQFKPCKFYGIFNDPVCVHCVTIIRSNADLERLVEVIDVSRPENRPSWLQGIPAIQDDAGKYYLGKQAVQWLEWQSKQTCKGINETQGVDLSMAGT